MVTGAGSADWLNSSLLDVLPERATLYWWGHEQEVRWKSDHNRSMRHAKPTARTISKGPLLSAFFDEALGLNFSHVAASHLDGNDMPLPWANWWLAPAAVFEDLAKLHGLLYHWLDARWPLTSVGCNATIWGPNTRRCWAYVGEELSIVFLMAETAMHHMGCGQLRPVTSPLTAGRAHGARGLITARVRERWAQQLSRLRIR
jgi:hypothetical protein